MYPFIVRDGILLLVCLAGIAAGIIMITQEHTQIGIYTIAGFGLLGLEPVADFVIFNFLSPTYGEQTGYDTFNWLYTCLSSIAMIGGAIALIVALQTAIRSRQADGHPDNQPVFAAEESKQ
jgi:hypothetical protein